MRAGKSIILWALSVLIMFGVVFYQRVTGPTYPAEGDAVIAGDTIEYTLPRSNDGDFTKRINIVVDDESVKGYIKYRRYKSYDDWSKESLERKGDTLVAEIPHQPAAGKVIYNIYLGTKAEGFSPIVKNPTIIRFRDPVPGAVVFFHVLFMFLTITFSVRTGFEAIFNGDRVFLYTVLTCFSLFIGGLIFGPIMQKYSFGAYWTGWPFGGDLTDNKTIVAFIVWMVAALQIAKDKAKRTWAIIASAVLLAVYLIPHSLLGSELDYRKIEKHKMESIENK